MMIGFRVDANETIATGHLMRCLAIAGELIKRGENVMFYLAENKETGRLEERNIPYRILHTDWREMEKELPEFKRELEKDRPDVLVVDSYQATARYLADMEQIVPVLYVDDMAEEKYEVSFVLHYGDWLEDNSYEERYSDVKTKVLAGMQYVPLRQEFYPAEAKADNALLLTTGGTDPYHMTRRVIEEMQKNGLLEKMDVHIVAGSMNPDIALLRELEENEPRIHFYHNVNDMGNLMRQCCCAVSAGGTTLFELCACKIPVICFSFADNQADFTRRMGEHQVMLYAGDARENPQRTAERIVEQLDRLIRDRVLQEKLSGNMGRLVDGKGTARIADALVSCL